jgi:hypothetical protein
MKYVNIDSLDDSVKQFVLGLSVEPMGAVLELKGQPTSAVADDLEGAVLAAQFPRLPASHAGQERG